MSHLQHNNYCSNVRLPTFKELLEQLALPEPPEFRDHETYEPKPADTYHHSNRQVRGSDGPVLMHDAPPHIATGSGRVPVHASAPVLLSAIPAPAPTGYDRRCVTVPVACYTKQPMPKQTWDDVHRAMTFDQVTMPLSPPIAGVWFRSSDPQQPSKCGVSMSEILQFRGISNPDAPINIPPQFGEAIMVVFSWQQIIHSGTVFIRDRHGSATHFNLVHQISGGYYRLLSQVRRKGLSTNGYPPDIGLLRLVGLYTMDGRVWHLQVISADASRLLSKQNPRLQK